MKMTIFNTPIIKTAAHWLSRLLLKILGWNITGELPGVRKYVMIAVPHTSNWDFFYGLLMILYFKNQVYWMGKKQIFRFPFSGIMKWFGGIPVDRSKTNNMVQSTIDEFNRRESLVVVIPPEGSRSKVFEWKTGFYHIASGAGVPILPGFLDYKKKLAGYGPLIYLSGDKDKDLQRLKEFYQGITGKFEDK
jgi:1-acyl-sn-glycerol-3-phosphate acyltransferase